MVVGSKSFLGDHLSIWDLAFRWHGHTPPIEDTQSIPAETQDNIRFLAEQTYYERCGVCLPNGFEPKTLRTQVRREDYRFGDSQSELTDVEKDEIYADYLERVRKQHLDLVEGMIDCFELGKFDRVYLQSIHLTKAWVYIICREHDLPLPSFWISEDEIDELNSSWTVNLIGGVGLSEDEEVIFSEGMDGATPISQVKVDTMWSQLKASQKTRLLCREIARHLWDKDLDRTIESICKDELMMAAGARHYQGRDTVRNWIKDLDPRPENKKRGRPSQKK